MNTGNHVFVSRNGLLTTIAAGLDEQIQYALKGSVFVRGVVIQWLQDELRGISTSEDAAYYAQKVSDTGGVYQVPVFTGLGVPSWGLPGELPVLILFGLQKSPSHTRVLR